VGTLALTIVLLITGGRVVAKCKGDDAFDDAGVGFFDTEGLLCPATLVVVGVRSREEAE